MQKAFVESMKTIVKSAVERAGFDKTRNGKVIGVNSVTNTYSVKVDGIIYNNVKTVNDTTCNVGDTVKVNIPMNNPSQAYITSSILSDDSIGKKLAQATTAIDEINTNIESIVEIMGSIYQLSIGVTYENRTVGSQTYVDATYTAILTQDGVDVTQQHQPSEFRWYLEKTTGKTNIANARSVTLSTENYLYGQAVMLEWELDEQPTLRSRVTLFNEVAVEEVAKYTTEITNGGVFVHRADGNYDVGSDWESVWAYGVKIADTVDIIKGGRIYGSFGGNYLTIGNTSENNIYMDSSGFIQLRNSSAVLADIRSGSITLGRTASSYYNVYMDTQHLYFRYGTDILTDITGGSITLGRSTAGYYSTLISSSSIKFRYNDNGTQRIVGDINNSGMQLYYYNSNIGNIDILSLNTNGMVLKNSSNIPIFQLINSSGRIISQNGTNTGTAGYQSMTTGANGGTYGQPGIAFCKRYSNGGWSEFEMRLNDTQQGAQIWNTNQVSISGGGSWNTQIAAASNGIFVYGHFYNYSDRRLKKHIRYLDEDECITFIRNLRPALFYKNDTKDIGLYAQDVKDIDEWDVFTEHVKGGIPHVPEDMLTLDYLGLIMPLIKCCQQLDKRIKELEQKE